MARSWRREEELGGMHMLRLEESNVQEKSTGRMRRRRYGSDKTALAGRKERREHMEDTGGESRRGRRATRGARREQRPDHSLTVGCLAKVASSPSRPRLFASSAPRPSLSLPMAILALFARKDKHKTNADQTRSNPASDLSADIDNASLAPPSVHSTVYNGPPAASSSKLMLAFRTPKSSGLSPSSPDTSLLRPLVSWSSARSEPDHDDSLRPPPSKSDLFATYADPAGARSTRSLPTDPLSLDPQLPVPPLKKTKGMFSWAHRERKKSKPPPVPVLPPPTPIPSTFAPSDTSRPSPPLPPPHFARPRGDSVASDSSQRISVAAFREMAARRSAANSPSPSSADMARPPSALASSRAPVRRTVPMPAESDESESDDEDSGGSATLRPAGKTRPGKSKSELGHHMRPTPPRMAPSASAQSAQSSQSAGRGSVYSRARASQSTSALQPNAAAQRASMLVAQKAKLPQRKDAAGASERAASSSSSESDTDSDDAPLARFVNPKRPGSATSNATSTSRARAPPKPLIDISALGVKPSPLQSPDTEKAPPLPAKGKEREPVVPVQQQALSRPRFVEEMHEEERIAPSPVEKPTLNDRLTRLAQSVASRSPDNLQKSPATANDDDTRAGASTGRDRLPQPTRSHTAPADSFFSQPSQPSPSSTSPSAPTKRTKPNGRSMSSPNAAVALESTPADPTPAPITLTDPPPIVPTPIRSREPPSSFSVTSRPASQLSIAQQAQQQTQQSQSTVRMVGAATSPASATSSPTVARPAPLIPDIGKPQAAAGARPLADSPSTRTSTSDGFTGGGLLASVASGPKPDKSPTRTRVAHNTPSASPAISGAARVARHRGTPSDAHGFSPAPLPDAEPARSETSARQRSGTLPPPAAPPKPFATPAGMRGNSPASSTGESSSGRTPITPLDGSEVGYAGERERAREGREKVVRRGHQKSTSVSFDEAGRGRAGVKEQEGVGESRRNERRRGEAKAALELGNIVNGRGPHTHDNDEEARPLDNMGPRMNMLHPMAGMGFNVTPPTPMSWQQPGMMSPQQFMLPMVPPHADAAFLAAHQQAMFAAKQAYQMAVAQQAMAAADEEWERGSTAATSVLGGGSRSAYGGAMPGMFPAPGAFGMGMPMGMQGGWGGMGMGFPASSQSMYAGSVAGSELGVSSGGRSAGWGSRSAYGESTGYGGSPAERASMMHRVQGYGAAPQAAPPHLDASGQGMPQRPGPRPRTKTGPSEPRDGQRHGGPPSSWKPGQRPT
ncbi:hypothetical protein B0H21DRAFT_890679 [Amylocystis lapponica]|nr:hypothetical protein B0H21DRAFT_890679 [Amylocystis lapponica]